MPEPSRTLRLLAAALSVAVACSALAGAVLALTANVRPAWALFGFEVVIAVSCVFGVQFGRGRYRHAPGMALACVAGSVFVGSVLGYMSLRPPALGGVGLKPFLAARVLVAGLIAGAGAACVLSRHPKSWRLAITGAVLGAPVMAAGAIAVIPALRGLAAPLTGMGPMGQLAAGVGLFVVLGGLLCASAHLLIRAFELGRPENLASEPRGAAR
ncbi:MAG: hypothetical protein ACKVU4_00185 [Phycisphaerales bacterium]